MLLSAIHFRDSIEKCSVEKRKLSEINFKDNQSNRNVRKKKKNSKFLRVPMLIKDMYIHTYIYIQDNHVKRG